MTVNLNRITTRTGDKGTTGLSDGSRVDKSDPRIAALGAADELVCALGMMRALCADTEIKKLTEDLQQRVFDLGAWLSWPHAKSPRSFENANAVYIEELTARLNTNLPPLSSFILPGANTAEACAHNARAVCRRFELSLWNWPADKRPPESLLIFLNRLSDLLFVLARILADGSAEVKWRG